MPAARHFAMFCLSVPAMACSLLSDVEGLYGAPTAGPEDASAGQDAAAEARAERPQIVDAGEDGADVADGSVGNMHPAGTFESGCAPWAGYLAKLSASADGHSGAACRVCATGTSGVYNADDTGLIPAVVGATYHGEVWVKGPAPGVQIVLRSSASNGQELETTASGFMSVGAAWVKLAVDHTIVNANTSKLNVLVVAHDVACFSLDDVVVTQTNTQTK